MSFIVDFIQTWGWQIASILLGAVVFYDRYIAPLTKTKKDDESLERILELLPDAIEERLLDKKKEVKKGAK